MQQNSCCVSWTDVSSYFLALSYYRGRQQSNLNATVNQWHCILVFAGLWVSAFSIWTSSESSQTPVPALLPERSADVGDQGHSFLTCLPPSVFIMGGLLCITQRTWVTGRPDASSQQREPGCLFHMTKPSGNLERRDRQGNWTKTLCLPLLAVSSRGSTQIWSSCRDWLHVAAPHHRGGYS